MIKVRCPPEKRSELKTLGDIFRGRVIDVSPSTMTFEVLGTADKMAAFQKNLVGYGVLEVARTGAAALQRESGVDVDLLEVIKSEELRRTGWWTSAGQEVYDDSGM